jgi:predicted amidohydrolase
MKKKQENLKVALLQFSAGPDKEANLKTALSMSQGAVNGSAQFILLPEVFNFRGDSRSREALLQAAETIPGPCTNAFVAIARKHKVSFLLGSILEKAPRAHVYNTSVFIDPRGRLTKYRKIHLFHAHIGDKIIRESDRFRAGRRPTRVSVGKFKAGLSVCYDLRFPDLYQGYARRGVELLTVPACFTYKTGKAHWETLLRARAIETLSYVLAPAQIGKDFRGIQAFGNSMIVSPWGEVVARGSSNKPEIVFGVISMDEVRRARQILPGIINN